MKKRLRTVAICGKCGYGRPAGSSNKFCPRCGGTFRAKVLIS